MADLPPPADTPRALHLAHALALLQRAGIALPEAGPSGEIAWLQALIDGLCELSSRDALTGALNRRSFELALDRELDRVARSGESALLLLLDLDHFKRVNDLHGHPVGDRVLQTVAQTLQQAVRPMDTVARIGGEEFALILPNCPPAFGEAVAERVRARLASRSLPLPGGDSLRITVSVGGAYAPAWVRSAARYWLARADAQLYRAKAEGRNRSCFEPSSLQPALARVSPDERALLFGTPPSGAPTARPGAAAE